MNANNIYAALHNQNDRLLEIKARLRKTVTRICGNAPPSPGKPLGAGSSTQAEPDYLTELSQIANANNDILDDLVTELNWLESTFGMNAEPYPTPTASLQMGSLNARS